MFAAILEGALELGAIYGLVGLGVYLTFRIARTADLTVDGSFALGAVTVVRCLECGVNPYVATLVGTLSGGAAGWVTARLIRLLDIDGVLPSILTMISLYTINLRLLGRPNAALLEEATIFDGMPSQLFGVVVIALVTLAALAGYLATDHGLAMRAVGANPRMAAAAGIRPAGMVTLAFVLGNALVGLAGALFAQTQGFVDVSMGTGTVILGLAAVLLGEAMLTSRHITLQLVACFAGALVYRALLALALNAGFLGLQAADLNLVTALLVTLALVLSRARKRLGRGRAA